MSVPKVSLSSGHQMPVIGVGMFLTKDPSEVSVTLSAAIDAGYRHIDTAFSYRNESLIGNSLQEIFGKNKVRREDLFIVTKLPPNGLRPDAVPHFFNKSLSDLQLDYVDLYHMHFPVASKRSEDDYAIFPMKDGLFEGDEVDLLDTWRAMEKLVESGVVRSLGLSNCNIRQIRRIHEAATIKPAVLQVECHAYLPQFELQELCSELGMVMTAYSPIGAPGQVTGSSEGRVLDDEKLKPICKRHGKSPAQVLLRYSVQRGIIVIPKSSNPKRLAENIQIFDFSLSEEEMLSLRTMARNKRYFNFKTYTGITDHPEYPF